MGESPCHYGFVSLPYLDGPRLEVIDVGGGETVRFYWLIPVDDREVQFKKLNGLEALEAAFEASAFNYLDPMRASAV